MDAKFKIGDKCIAHSLLHRSDCDGQECVIVGNLQPRYVFNRATGERAVRLCYLVRFARDVVGAIAEHRLRLVDSLPSGEQTIFAMFDMSRMQSAWPSVGGMEGV